MQDNNVPATYHAVSPFVLTHGEICAAVSDAAFRYPIKSASYFGSYARGMQRPDSDLDLLVEFQSPFVSLFKVAGLKLELEEKLHKPVDVIGFPLPDNAYLIIDKQVKCYG
ncbi:hypothetical protein AGMMS49992_26980 [Clostridia bacterium]|nr:hypothetical protein AGMMS49992_26980 [Clostridia bacterium]